MKIEIGELIEAASQYVGIPLQNNEEIDIRELGCYVKTPQGKATINYVIKKTGLSGIKIDLLSGNSVKCAYDHILRMNQEDIFAKNLKVGDQLDTINGPDVIVNINPIDDTVFYDIGIDYPHIYYDHNGIEHHNTLICGALQRQVEQYGRSLIIVPNRDLVDQTYKDYLMLGLDVGKIYHGHKDLDKTHTITTWQQLNSINKKKADLTQDDLDLLLDGTMMVIQDELHLATSKVLFDINSKLMKNVPLQYGMTGTIPKDDHLVYSIRANFGDVVYRVPASELQEKGILASCEVQIHQINTELTTFKDYHTEKKYVNTNEDVLSIIAQDALEVRKKGDKSNTLILVENIETGQMLSEMIPDSVFLHGSVKSEQRQEGYDEFKDKDGLTFICTFGIASTGISINRIFNLFLVQPGKSFTKVIQSIGRGLRVAKDKDFVSIRDYSTTTKYQKRHLTERKKYYKDAEYPFKVIKR